MLLIHKDISHMPITELENDSESVWVKVFTNEKKAISNAYLIPLRTVTVNKENDIRTQRP